MSPIISVSKTYQLHTILNNTNKILKSDDNRIIS
jgi:hypothetical protein